MDVVGSHVSMLSDCVFNCLAFVWRAVSTVRDCERSTAYISNIQPSSLKSCSVTGGCLMIALKPVPGTVNGRLSRFNVREDMLQPPLVDASVTSQLGMEACAENIPLLHSNNLAGIAMLHDTRTVNRRWQWQATLVLEDAYHTHWTRLVRLIGRPCGVLRWGHDCRLELLFLRLHTLHRQQYPLHDGSSDEDPSKGFPGKEGKAEIGLETLRLAPEVVALHAHVEATDELLATFLRAVRCLGKQDHACAGSPCRTALCSAVSVSFVGQMEEQSTRGCKMQGNSLDEISKRLYEIRTSGDEGHGGALAAWNDECIALRQLLAVANLCECPNCAESFDIFGLRRLLEQDNMLVKGTL